MKKIILIVVLLAMAGWYYFNTNPNASIGATLSYVEGAVEYKKDSDDWKRAEANTDLFEGNEIEILGEGKAIINFDDGSAIRLNSNSKMTLESMDPKNIVLTQEKGEVYARVVKADRVFEIQTDDTKYESLGTAYKITNTPDKEGVDVYHNAVKIIKDEKETVVNQGSQYFVKHVDDPSMEKTVLEIAQKDLEEDDFVVWNAKKDAQNKDFEDALGVLTEIEEIAKEIPLTAETEVTTTEEVEEELPITQTIAPRDLIIKSLGSNKVSWVANKFFEKGYKVVWSQNSGPTYPTRSGDKYKYLSNPSSLSATLDAFNGTGTYYIRVCEYLGGACGVYSNEIQVTLNKEAGKTTTPKTETGNVKSINLQGSGASIAWAAIGHSKSGFKVVWSQNPGPTYPTRSGDKYHYFSNPDQMSDTLKAFNGNGTYYVRVCEYLGGKCGLYSNEIQVNLVK